MVKGEIKPIENEEKCQICFTKRRQSLFNKASELSLLCGAMVGSVVFSPFAGTPFSFGHPSIDDVANRFLNNSGTYGPASGSASNVNSWAVPDSIHTLNIEHSELQQSLDSEKKRKEMLQQATDKKMGEHMMQLLNTNIWELSLDELQEFQKCLEAIDGVVKEKANTMLETSQTQGLVPQPPGETAPALQYQSGEHISSNPMAFTAPSLTNEFDIDGFDVDDFPLLGGGGLEDVCGLGNLFPDNQNHG